jgi:beta-lactamase regulating signal transducer with metallopeptidase domain
MDLLHFHLVLNHVPVIGMGIVLLLLVGALLRRSAELMRATLVLIVVLGLAALGAFFTGEPAEDGVEHLPGISKATISAHEEAAELALAAMETLAVIALLGLLMWARRPAVPGCS